MVSLQNEFLNYIVRGAPADYPISSPVDGEHQIPFLLPASESDIPLKIIAFNDCSRAEKPSETGVHFYRDDAKFAHFMLLPTHYAKKFSEFKVTLTPDSTLGRAMPEWLRIRNTVHSRQCGVALQSRGIRVIPTLRWVCPSDYAFVTSGIEIGSVFAVSSYGCYRDPDLKFEFERGLIAIVEKLKPAAIMFYGVAEPKFKLIVEKLTNVYYFPINEFRENTALGVDLEPTLFEL